MRGIARDLVAYGLLSGVTQVSSLLLLPILTRALSVDEYGAVDVVATLVAFLALTLQLALPSALARHWGDDPSRQSSLVSTLLALLGLAGAAVLLIVHAASVPLAGLLLGDPGEAGLLRLGAAIAWLTSLTAVLETVLRMERRIVAFNALQLTRMLVYVGLAVFLVVERGAGVRGVFVAQAISWALVLAAALFATRRHLAPRVSREWLGRLLRFGAPLVPGQLVLWVNGQTDRLVLLAFVGLSGVGLFGVPARFATGLQFLLLVFRQAWQPHAMRVIEAPERDALYRRTLVYFGAGFAALALWVSALGPELLALAVPPEFHTAYPVLPWLLGATVLHNAASITNLGLVATGETGGVSVASLAAVMLNVPLALVLIPSFGIAGAALGAFVSELALAGLLMRMSARSAGLRFDARAATEAVLVYVVACAGMVLAWWTLDGVASTAVRVALAAAGSLLVARAPLAASRDV